MLIKKTTITLVTVATFMFLTSAFAETKNQAPALAGTSPQIRTIQKVNLPAEKTYSAQVVKIEIPNSKDIVALKVNSNSPAYIKTPETIALIPVENPKIFTTVDAITQIQAVKPLDYINDPLTSEPLLNQKNLVEIKPEEYKMIQAMIFLNYKKKYDLAMALFVELLNVPDYKSQAMFHYAETAMGLKLNSEFRQKMISVVKEAKDPVLKKLALESLVKNIDFLQVSDVSLIDPLIKSFDVDIVNFPAYLLKKAKYYSKKGDLAEVENALLLIPTTAKEFKEGVLLKSIFNYRRGDLDTAVQDLEALWPIIEENKKDQTRNLSALTLARLYFQKADYKNAYKYYLAVDRSSAQWLQSIVEQAWTQILAGDNEGAAGNMFSLHTDFFKKAYAPDTYIVRTVGYLNLCQYGDGMHVLEDLNKKYKSIAEKLASFQSSNKEAIQYYDLIKTFLQNSKKDDYSGVPRAFLVELARHPSYINPQAQINSYEDENSRFNKITIDIIRKERETRLESLKAKNSYAQAKRDGKSGADLLALEKVYLTKGVENLIYSRGREAIKKMREAAVARLSTEKSTLLAQSSQSLKSRFDDLVTNLNHMVEQQEVLSYEIYSGAGEHIRFQMAGGEANTERKPESLNPTDKDHYQWKFKGEVWDDEIGHYRSSLKNVCPKEDVATLPTPNE